MYLEHHVLAKIAQVLSQMNMKVMLLDGNGQVLLPEDNQKELTIPQALTKNPTKPFVYGGFTLIGTEES